MDGAREDEGGRAAIPDGPGPGGVRLTRLEQALDWAAGLMPSPVRLATSCCGLAMARGGDFFEAIGTAPPAVSARSADLLIVAGSLTRRQLPLVRGLYERMVGPRWVMAWGACAISGGPYDNYATLPGLSTILPVDVHVPGCPPAPAALRVALDRLRECAAAGASRRSQRRPIRTVGSAAPWRPDPGLVGAGEGGLARD